MKERDRFVGAFHEAFREWLVSTRAYIEAQEGAGTDSGVVAEALERSFQAKLDDVATRLLGKKLVGPKSSPVMSRALRELDRRRRACEAKIGRAHV